MTTTLSAPQQLLDHITALDIPPTLSSSTSSSSLSSIETETDNLGGRRQDISSNESGFYLKDNSSLVTLIGQLHNSASSSTINLMNDTDSFTTANNYNNDFLSVADSASSPTQSTALSMSGVNSASMESLTQALSSLRSPSPSFTPYDIQRISFFPTASPPLPSSCDSDSFNNTVPPVSNNINLQPPFQIDSDFSAPSTASSSSTLASPRLPKKLKSSLKLPGLKRSNSLPQGMDGNSTSSKQVRFSNNLTRVKTFSILSKPMSVSANLPEPVFLTKDYSKPMFMCYDSGNDDEDESSSDDEGFFKMKPKANKVSPIRKSYRSSNHSKHILKLHNFKTPNMLRGTERIKLIELKIDSINNFELLGVIHVVNLCFEKKVEIKYSIDNWKSNFIHFANYHKSINSRTDEFQFKINFKNLIKSKDYSDNNLLQICLIYCANNETYYDNNSNENYKLTIVDHDSSSTSKSASTSTSNTRSTYSHERLTTTSTIKSNFTGDFNHKYYFPATSTTASSSPSQGSNFFFSSSSSASSSSSTSSSNTSVSSNSSNSSLSTMDLTFKPSTTTPSTSSSSSVSPCSISSPQPHRVLDSEAYNEFLSKYCYKTSY
ncbi:hypothetical protein WICPIJ_006064 [Wickerhamomyces pijperi]|uniref:CBM21 domain-containing protein n=1 Tax=Wickerhamomyces pijperi TaxID=599730 RepID=A0A9P8Q4I9_WICPI|nr:hypothetical protein WICPIJ_006064 [Wickerhamomyces pijperi]